MLQEQLAETGDAPADFGTLSGLDLGKLTDIAGALSEVDWSKVRSGDKMEITKLGLSAGLLLLKYLASKKVPESAQPAS